MAAIPERARVMLDEQRLAFVASVNDDGTPNLSPKGTVAAYDGDHLLFADLASPRTVANLRARPAVVVNVFDPLTRKGHRFEGRAEVIGKESREWLSLLEFLGGRGLTRPAERVRAVVRIRVDRVRPLVSPAYDAGMSESDLTARWAEHYARLARREPVSDPEGPATPR